MISLPTHPANRGIPPTPTPLPDGSRLGSRVGNVMSSLMDRERGLHKIPVARRRGCIGALTSQSHFSLWKTLLCRLTDWWR